MTASKPKTKAFENQISSNHLTNQKPIFSYKSDEIADEITDAEYLNNQNNIAFNILNIIKQ